MNLLEKEFAKQRDPELKTLIARQVREACYTAFRWPVYALEAAYMDFLEPLAEFGSVLISSRARLNTERAVRLAGPVAKTFHRSRSSKYL